MKKICLYLMVFIFFVFSKRSFSDENSPEEEISVESQTVESLYEDFTQKEEKKDKSFEFKNNTYKKVSDLIRFSPFKDIAVIQRRFFPKTHRFEFSVNGIFNTRNTFFQNFGGALRMNYYISESLGFGASYYQLVNHQNDIVGRLEDRRLLVGRPVRPKQYIGGNIHWNPIYGKMSLFGINVIPFDMHFSLYLGGSVPEDSPASLSGGLGVGQTFPLNKSFLIRWDFNWNVYRPKGAYVIQGEDRVAPINYNHDFFFSMGLSVFFPGAKYR